MSLRPVSRLVSVVCLWLQPYAFGQQQQSTPMPAGATGIMTQMDREIIASKKKAVDGLEKVLRETTKKGDLAGAMAVKQNIDRLNGEIASLSGGKPGRDTNCPDILGRWQGQGWSIEFFPDGTAAAIDKSFSGTWSSNGQKVEATWSNGVTHAVERDGPGWSGVWKQSGRPGGAVRYNRIP